jgi:hypothetical protein
MPDWYEENIEEGVRDLVRLLRDNGFNTTCSCHHDMEVMVAVIMDGEMKWLHDLLYNSGHKDYSLQYNVNVSDGYVINEWVSVRMVQK